MGSVALEGFGGGSNPLNYKVICNPQPETAKENTIWVDTDRINNYYFSATQPENMAEYDVWFPIGTSSTVAFSATKKSHIMVYPLSAKQFISGTLVAKTAESFQGGKWNSWIRYLYNAGNSYTNIGGEWIAYYKNGTFELKSDHISVVSTKADSGAIIIGKDEAINVSDIDRIIVKAEIVNANADSSITVGVAATKVSTQGGVSNAPAKEKRNVGGEVGNTIEVVVDVSTVSGNYYVFISNTYLFNYKILSVSYVEG